MFSKKMGLAVLTVLTTTLAGHQAFAATATGNASASVITPIAISETSALAFGKIDASTGGTVTVSTGGVRSKTGAVVLVSTGSTQNQGTFHVTGAGSSTYSITLPADGVVNLSDGASHTMAVNTFVSNPSGTGTLSSGAQDVNVGATLIVASAQVAGNYSGTYSVSVDYN